jgi:hypothetical protein
MPHVTVKQPGHFARLSFEDGQVIVTPKDKSIFLISAEKATEACRNAVRVEERIQLFETEFLFPLHDWCMRRMARLRGCYVPVPRAGIQVFIVTASPQFDFDLGEEIAQLELKLAQGGWRVSIVQLPDTQELETFFNPDGALQVYAERGPAPQEGGTESPIP